MVHKIKDFIRYSLTELENYTKSENSCIKKIRKKIHINFPPYGLAQFKTTLLNIIAERKIGFYDSDSNGIILDIRNIKVLGNTGAIRFDDPQIHINIEGDCYIFQPKVGTIVQGLVKHISQRQIGVIIYRVFSVPIRLTDMENKSNIKLNTQIEFRIKKFDLQHVMPYIEGELIANEERINKSKSIQFEYDDDGGILEYDNENISQESDIKPSACEIIGGSDNEEIVFSKVFYINNEEANKIKKHKKKEKNSQETTIHNKEQNSNKTPKSVSFADTAKKRNHNHLESDSEQNTSIKQNNILTNGVTKSDNVSLKKEIDLDVKSYSSTDTSENSNIETNLNNTMSPYIKREIISPQANQNLPSTSKNNKIIKKEIKFETNSESEDIFHEYSQIPLNQEILSKKTNKNESKKRKTKEIDNTIENFNLKNEIKTEVLSQQSSQSSNCSFKSKSESSFSKKCNEILEKKIKEKQLKNSQSDVIKSQKSTKRSSLNSSMADILKFTIAKAQSTPKTLHKLNNREDNNSEIDNKVEHPNTSNNKKSRKRKISINDSMQEILLKTIAKKSKLK